MKEVIKMVDGLIITVIEVKERGQWCGPRMMAGVERASVLLRCARVGRSWAYHSADIRER